MRKLFIGSFIIVIVLLAMLLIAVNTPVVVKKVAKRFAPNYEITYDDITGNVLDGITIHSPKYRDLSLAKELTLRLNPAALLQKKISFTKVVVEEGNATTIEKLIGSFSTDTKDDTSESSFSFVVGMEEVEISLLPFIIKDISFSHFTMSASMLSYAEDKMDIEALALSLKSNIADIILKGSYGDREVHVSTLNLKKVDIPTLQKFISSFEKSDASSKTDDKKENQKFYLPNYISVDKIYLNAKPTIIDPVQIQKFNLDGSNIAVDLESGLVEEGSLFFDARSNLSNILYKGEVQENTLVGKVALTPHKRLFEVSGLPLRKEAFGDIVIDLLVSRSNIQAGLKASARQILIGKKGEFNIDIDSFESNVEYRIEEQKVISDSKVMISTPYAKNISLTNRFMMDQNITYHGEIYTKELYGLEENLTGVLHDINVTYHGDDHLLDAKLTSDALEGSFGMQNYQKGTLQLKTKKAVRVSTITKLPEKLEDTEVQIEIKLPFDLIQNKMIKGMALLRSNLVNVDTDITLSKTIQVKSKVILPEESLLRSIDPKIKWDKLTEADIDLMAEGNSSTIDLKTKELNLQAIYKMNDQTIQGSLKSKPLHATFDGNLSKEFKLNASVGSLKSLTNFISSYYIVDEIPNVEGSVAVNAAINKEKKIDISLRSPQIIYNADRESAHTLSDIDMDVSIEDTQMTLQRYKLTYNDLKLYATKSSLIQFKGSELQLSPLWINDTLQIAGEYNLKTLVGKIEASADKLKVEHEWADIISDIDIKTVADGNYTDVNGEIVLQGGNVHYDMKQKSFATDSDIVIVDGKEKKEANSFMDQLSMAVNIESNKPLLIKQPGINIQAKPSFTLYKGMKEPLMVLGSIELLKGGTYQFQNKRFTLEKSFIYFTGTLNKPLLEIKAKHQAVKHLITITVTGTPEAPNINFSSSPSLTREQILSVLLFDSETGGDTYSGEEMMKMMGGAMAKSALVNAGVKIDHLVLGEGNSIEVGKKLTKDIMIIYINGDIPKVELKYRHSRSFESVVGASGESSSYDIIYTKDF